MRRHSGSSSRLIGTPVAIVQAFQVLRSTGCTYLADSG